MADNTIALGIRPPAPEDYGALAQSRMNAMTLMSNMDKERRGLASQNAFTNLVNTPGFNINNPADLNKLFATGDPRATALSAAFADQAQNANAAMTAQTGARNAQTSAGTLTQKQIEEGQKVVSGHLSRLTSLPAVSDEDLNIFGQDMLGLHVTADVIAATLAPFRRLTPEQRAPAIKQAILGDPQMRAMYEFSQPKPVAHDRGDQIDIIDENPNSPTYLTVMRTMAKGAAPQGRQIVSTAAGMQVADLDSGDTVPLTQGVPGAPAPAGGGVPVARAAAPGAFGAAIDQAVGAVFPGAHVSSGARTPAQNAAAGGVANSFHGSDNARDYDSFPGMTLAQGAAALKQLLEPQGYQVIFGGPDHRNHVHVEPGPSLATSRAPAAADAPAPAGAPIMPYVAPKVPTETENAKAAAKVTARANFTALLREIRGAYAELDRMNAIGSSERGTGGRNALAYVGASGPGQIAGKVFATKAQSQRNRINNARTRLINLLVQTENTGARQMDSNVELKNALESLGSPGQDVESVFATLDNLATMYANTDEDSAPDGSTPAPARGGGAAAPAGAPGRGGAGRGGGAGGAKTLTDAQIKAQLGL